MVLVGNDGDYSFLVVSRLIPPGGAYPATEIEARFGQGTLLHQLWHITLPALVLAASYAGFLSRMVRSAMLEVLRQEYILTARSKGLKERVVIYTHAFRNAMLPVVTVIGLQMGAMLGGAATVETVFAWPGRRTEPSAGTFQPMLEACAVSSTA